MRSVFSMFAQSVGLLPGKAAFTDLLEACRTNLASFVPLVGDMWRTMDTGGFSSGLRADLRRFNGGLFAPGPHGAVAPLPIEADMLDLLIAASKRDWSEVEPAIFGTLLENAINKHERGRLGAHFTPRAFVERLVQPALMDPLLAEWDGVKASALLKAEAGDNAGAADAVRGFHARLCAVRVLDPACGTANFLYVALDMMKRLEGEVLDVLADLVAGEGDRLDLTQATVDPHQFLGLELNPRAVPVAELVLWLGWLQWHFRNRPGREVAEPILRDFHNIRHADALLDYREEEVMKATRWGGRTKPHPITGEDVPDETDRVLTLRPKGCEADRVAGGRFHRRQPAVHRRQGSARRAWRRLRGGAVGGVSEGQPQRRPRALFLVEGSAGGGGGEGAAVRVHHVELAASGVLPPRGDRRAGGADAGASGVRRPRPSVDGRERQRRRADRDDGRGGREW